MIINENTNAKEIEILKEMLPEHDIFIVNEHTVKIFKNTRFESETEKIMNAMDLARIRARLAK